MRTILICLVLAWMIACTSAPISPFHESLDQETGVTVSRMNQAMIFYDPKTSPPPSTDDRDDKPGRRLAWRDFLYLGPLEINRTGRRSYYMWASLVRRERTQQSETPSGMLITADEHSIELRVSTVERSALGVGGPTYPPPAPWAAELYMPVTPEQLALLAAAEELTAHVYMPSDGQLLFKPVRNDQAAVRDFVKFVVEGRMW